ncbi:hypothetical protein ASV10_24535 [Enterobacter hormaechei subsp. xiangfangensis]|nr:hypothetical protein ASV10_24535 [Enterobacter hormaechei subsp. xiangfangensis]
MPATVSPASDRSRFSASYSAGKHIWCKRHASTLYIVLPDAFEQVEHAGTTSLIGIGHNMAIRLKHNSTRITARTAKHSGNHPHKEQTFIGAKIHKVSW